MRHGLALAAAVLVGTALWAPHAAAADNTLTGSAPAAGSTVTTAPTSMVLNFADPLGADNRVVATCNSQPQQLGAAKVGTDQKSLTVALPDALLAGTCNVTWRVSAPDGSPAGSGTFSFTVAASAGASTAPPVNTGPTVESTAPGSADGGATASPGAGIGNGPLGILRLFSTFTLAILFGSFVLISLAWPEGVEYILTVRFLRIIYYVAVLTSILFVIGLTSQVTGKGFGASISPGQWRHLTDTGPGVAALFQLVFTIGCAWVIIRPERLIDPASQLPSLAIPAIAVGSLGFSRSLGDLAVLGAAMGIIHALSMAVWFGGLVLLARVVLAGPGESDLVHAVRGFARISTPAILLTVLSGAVQTYRLDRGSLFSTGHGYVTLLKTAVVVVMVFVGLAARQFVHQRMQRADAMSVQMAGRLRRAVGFEALAGVLVLALSAWMLGLPPAHASTTTTPAPDRTFGPPQLIRNSENGVEVQVALTQVVGPNAVRVDVLKAPADFNGLDVVFTPPTGAGVGTVTLNVPLNCTCSAILPQSSGVPLGSPGTWTVTVRINGVDMGSKNVLVSAPSITSTTGTATSTPAATTPSATTPVTTPG